MNIVIAADYADVGKIKQSFKNFTRLKGDFPTIKVCHDEINEYKYEYDKQNKTGGIRADYPYNVRNKIRDYSFKYDIVIIPVDRKLIKLLRKYKKINRLYIYEEDKGYEYEELLKDQIFDL